jgi:hypothetical protein
MAKKEVTPGRERSEEEKAAQRERMRKVRERDKRNRALVKQMGLVDDDGELLKPGKAKSAMQRANEARLELQTQVLDMYAAGMSVDDISIQLDLHLGQTKRLVEEGMNQITSHYARATPAENFARYAFFHSRTVQRLDRLIDNFIDDPESKQYNAAVQALRARSDLLDKVYSKGKALGVMNLTKAAPERGMTGEALVAALLRERQQLDAVIAELKITVTEKTVSAAVKRAPKGAVTAADAVLLPGDDEGVTALQDEDPQLSGGNGTRDLLSDTTGDALASAIVEERSKDRTPGAE